MLRIELDNGKAVDTDDTVDGIAERLNKLPYSGMFLTLKEGTVIAIDHVVTIQESQKEEASHENDRSQ